MKALFEGDAPISKDQYHLLQGLDWASHGGMSELLNRYQLEHMSVCPACFCDDFTHVEGCPEDQNHAL